MSEMPTTAAATGPFERLTDALANARKSLTLASRAVGTADTVLVQTRDFIQDLGQTGHQPATATGPDVPGGRAYARYIASQAAGARASVAAADAALDAGQQNLAVARQALTELELRPDAERQTHATGKLRMRIDYFDQVFDESRRTLAGVHEVLGSAQERLSPQADREWTPYGVEQAGIETADDVLLARTGLNEARHRITGGVGNAMSAQSETAGLAKTFQAGTNPTPSSASTSTAAGVTPPPGGPKTSSPNRSADPRDRT